MAVKMTVAKGFDTEYPWRSMSPQAVNSAGYYMSGVEAGEPPGRWYGTGAGGLGLTQGSVIDKQVYDQLFRFKIGPGGEKLGRAPNGSRKAEEIYERLVAAEPHADDSRRRELRIQAQGQARQSPLFFDLTTSVSKSISVFHASIGENHRQAVLAGDDDAAALWSGLLDELDAMIYEANGAALDYIQREAGFVRAGTHAARVDGAESGKWLAGDLVIASFRQNTSRDGDPQIHNHNLIVHGAITREDGKGRSPDSRLYYENARGAASVMSVHLDHAMTRRFGVEWVERADGQGFEIKGIPELVTRAFSSRRTDVQRHAAEVLVPRFEEAYGRKPSQAELCSLQQKATLATRDGKGEAVIDWPKLRAEWAAKAAREAGADLGSFARGLGNGGARDASARDPQPEPDLDALARVVGKALEKCASEKASWTRADLLSHVGRMMPRTGADPAAMVRLAEEVTNRALAGEFAPVSCLEASELLAVPESRREDGRSVYTRPGSARYATRAQLSAEERLAELAMQQGAPSMAREDAARELGATVDELEAALAGRANVAASAITGSKLRLDQAAAVYHALTADRRLVVISAAAGAGKTTSATVMARLWETIGRDVVGVTPSQASRNTLAEGIERSHNFADFLGHLKEGRGIRGVTRIAGQTLVVIDEASMLSTPDMADVLEHAAANDGRVVLVGDVQQLQAVESGGAMGMLARRQGHLSLAEPVRFRDQEWEAQASVRFRAGDVSVLAEYADHGRIFSGDLEHLLDQAAEAYVARHVQGQDVLMIVQTHELRQELARRIRGELRHMGVVTGRSVKIGDGQDAAAGDLLVCTANDAQVDTGDGHKLANNDFYRVEEVTDRGGLVLRRALEGDRATGLRRWSEHTFTVSDLSGFQSGYGVTDHTAQSRTVRAGLQLITGSESRQAAYVGSTRGTDENLFFVVTPNPRTSDALPVVRPAPELARYERVQAQRAGVDPGREQGDIDSALAVLADVLGNDAEELSALEYRDRAMSNADHLGLLYPIFVAETQAARGARYRELIAGALPDGYREDGLGDAERWLWRTLRACELSGLDASEVIRQAVAQSSVAGSRDVSAVIEARIRKATGSLVPLESLSFAEQVPELADPQARQFVTELARIMDGRRERIGDHLTEVQPGYLVTAIGPTPEDPVERLAYQRRAAAVGAYREMFGYDGTDPIGPEPAAAESPDKRAMWFEAARALGPVEDAQIKGKRDGQLWLMRDQWVAEHAWSPRYVGRELGYVRASAVRMADQAVLADAEAARSEAAGDAALAGVHRERAEARRASERLYRAQEEALARTAEDRSDWEQTTGQQRMMALAADSELRRRYPERKIEPLAGADDPVTEEERARLDGPQVPDWVTELAEASREFRERLADRQSMLEPEEDHEYGYIGPAFPQWQGRDPAAVLVPPVPEMPASELVAERAAEMEMG